MAKKRIEKLKVKVDLKVYKKIARDLFSLRPAYTHKNKKKYNRKRDKSFWKRQIKQELY